VIEDAEKQNKISELYDLVHQSESMAAALPEVVDRLETLQGLHEQGSIISMSSNEENRNKSQTLLINYLN
jgi:Dynamitin